MVRSALSVRPLIGIVRRFVGHIETEWPLAVLLDEAHGVPGDEVGAVSLFRLKRGAVPPIGHAGLIDVRDIVHVPAHVSAELVETVLVRIEPRLVAQMPLPENSRPAARGF